MKLLQRNFYLIPPSSTHNKHPHNPSKLPGILHASRRVSIPKLPAVTVGNHWLFQFYRTDELRSLSPLQFSRSQETENCNMAANSHCFAGANTHLAVSDHQKTWESAAQTSTFSMIAKLLTEEQILFQQDPIKASKSHKRNKRKGRQLWSKKVNQVFYYYKGHLIEVYYYSLYGTLWCFLDCFNTSAVLFCTGSLTSQAAAFLASSILHSQNST